MGGTPIANGMCTVTCSYAPHAARQTITLLGTAAPQGMFTQMALRRPPGVSGARRGGWEDRHSQMTSEVYAARLRQPEGWVGGASVEETMPYVLSYTPYVVRYTPYVVRRTFYAYVIRRTLYAIRCTPDAMRDTPGAIRNAQCTRRNTTTPCNAVRHIRDARRKTQDARRKARIHAVQENEKHDASHKGQCTTHT